MDRLRLEELVNRPESLTRVLFRREPLKPMKGYDFVKSTGNGAINLFVGTIRNEDFSTTKSKDIICKLVKSIYYEAYESMAGKDTRRIVQDCIYEYCQTVNDVLSVKVSVEMRLGVVPVGEAAIVICASSKHRHLSNRLIMAVLSMVKARVPIWKKIIFTDGSEQWDLLQKSEAEWLPGMATVTGDKLALNE